MEMKTIVRIWRRLPAHLKSLDFIFSPWNWGLEWRKICRDIIDFVEISQNVKSGRTHKHPIYCFIDMGLNLSQKCMCIHLKYLWTLLSPIRYFGWCTRSVRHIWQWFQKWGSLSVHSQYLLWIQGLGKVRPWAKNIVKNCRCLLLNNTFHMKFFLTMCSFP